MEKSSPIPKVNHKFIGQRYQDVLMEFNPLLHKCLKKYQCHDCDVFETLFRGVRLKFLFEHYCQLESDTYRFHHFYHLDVEYWEWREKTKETLIDIRALWHEWVEDHYARRGINLGDLHTIIQLTKYLAGDLREWYQYIEEPPPPNSHFVGKPLYETLFLEIA